MIVQRTRAILLALSLGLLAACSDSGSDKPAQGASAPAAGGTLEAAKAAGKIRIGYANEAPFAFMDSKEAKVTGESVEIARVVLKRMGINEVEGVLTEFGSLIPGLQAKRFDIIAAGMYVTPERCGQVAFSNPTYGVGQAFLVKQGNPKELVALQRFSQFLKEYKAIPKAHVHYLREAWVSEQDNSDRKSTRLNSSH